jgi:hypothetical protein
VRRALKKKESKEERQPGKGKKQKAERKLGGKSARHGQMGKD